MLPPPLYVSAESVQSMHQDRCRCIQVHTLRLCPPFPVRACAFGLYLILLYLYYNTVILIVKCIPQSQTPVRTSVWLRDLTMKREMIINFTLRADVLCHRLLGLVISTVDHQDCYRSVCCKSFVSENLCEKLLPLLSRLPFVFFEVTGAYWTCPASYVQVLSFFDPRHISRLLEIILYSVGD